jgi:dTDP-4-amino-4,6-dideoxy-D-galactose acyltransferase
VRDDGWLAQRLGRAVLTWDEGDDPASVADAAARRAPAFAQAKVPAGDLQTVGRLEDAGFRVVDVNVTLDRSAGPLDVHTAGAVGTACPDDAPALLEIAERHYGVSRFHLDPRVPGEVAARIKRDWLQAYLDGERGERLLAVRTGDRALGFLAVLAAEPGVAVIDLIAVHGDHRGAGLGGALVAHLVREAGDRVRVGTQVANVAALRFYERLGFTILETRFVMHLHV